MFFLGVRRAILPFGRTHEASLGLALRRGAHAFRSCLRIFDMPKCIIFLVFTAVVAVVFVMVRHLLAVSALRRRSQTLLLSLCFLPSRSQHLQTTLPRPLPARDASMSNAQTRPAIVSWGARRQKAARQRITPWLYGAAWISCEVQAHCGATREPGHTQTHRPVAFRLFLSTSGQSWLAKMRSRGSHITCSPVQGSITGFV